MSEPESRAGSRRSEWFGPEGISAIVAAVTLVGGALGGLFAAMAGSGGSTPPPEPSEPPGPALFVYGSWEPDGAHWERIRRYVDGYTEDEVAGTLFDSGRGYAFATFGGRGTVPGVLLEFEDADAFGSATDALVQFGTDLFDRVQVDTESGRTVTAYEWAQSADGYPAIGQWDDALAAYGQEVPVNKMMIGDCFDVSDTVAWGITVNCSAPHQFEVYHRDAFTDELFPGVPALEATAYAECSRLHEAHLGRVFDPAGAGVYYPSEASWAGGDRALVCAAVP
jgi:gamma-glutamylcyclotransferase (GGCT)/AIG2-like uncharacterized protein YtfP